MKKKVFKSKLSLNKTNIANLSNMNMENAKGGGTSMGLDCMHTMKEDSICPCIHPIPDPFSIVQCDSNIDCELTANC